MKEILLSAFTLIVSLFFVILLIALVISIETVGSYRCSYDCNGRAINSSSVAVVTNTGGEGWYIVWKVFLSKFKFVQEILGKSGTDSQEEKPRKPRTKVRRE